MIAKSSQLQGLQEAVGDLGALKMKENTKDNEKSTVTILLQAFSLDILQVMGCDYHMATWLRVKKKIRNK